MPLSAAARVGALGWLTALTVLALVVPLVSLILRMLEGTRSPLVVGQLVSAAVTSVAVSSAGAVLAVVLAVPVGILAGRYRTR